MYSNISLLQSCKTIIDKETDLEPKLSAICNRLQKMKSSINPVSTSKFKPTRVRKLSHDCKWHISVIKKHFNFCKRKPVKSTKKSCIFAVWGFIHKPAQTNFLNNSIDGGESAWW